MIRRPPRSTLFPYTSSSDLGGSMALALSSLGIRNILVTKYRWLADTPRAHITNQRTMEVLRDFGVEAEAAALATPDRKSTRLNSSHANISYAVFCLKKKIYL